MFIQPKDSRRALNVDQSFLKEKIRMTPCDRRFIAKINQREFAGFSYVNSSFELSSSSSGITTYLWRIKTNCKTIKPGLVAILTCKILFIIIIFVGAEIKRWFVFFKDVFEVQ